MSILVFGLLLYTYHILAALLYNRYHRADAR